MTPARVVAESGSRSAGGAKAGAWLRLIRPHFIPLSVSAGLAGIAAGQDAPDVVGVTLALVVCAGGYGVGVVVNDFADRRADAINAPERPFVAGEIDPHVGLAVVLAAAAATAVAGLALAPAVAIWGTIALAGHVVYQATKGVPMVGNVINGIDLALFTAVGAAGARTAQPAFDLPSAVWVDVGLMALVLSGFCLVGYFKDVPGDRLAGYRTLPVALGASRARWLTLPFPLAAVAAATVVAATNPDAIGAQGDASAAFWPFLAAAAAAFAIGLRRLVDAPEANAYEALVWYTRGCVLFALALTAAPEPVLALAVAAPLMAFLELNLRQTREVRQA